MEVCGLHSNRLTQTHRVWSVGRLWPHNEHHFNFASPGLRKKMREIRCDLGNVHLRSQYFPDLMTKPGHQFSTVYARFLCFFRNVTSGLRRPSPLACTGGHAAAFVGNAGLVASQRQHHAWTVPLHQGCPESCFQTPAPLLLQNFLIRIRVQNVFKFENPPPVQTPATIDATEIQRCLYLSNDIHKDCSDSCYCQNKK